MLKRIFLFFVLMLMPFMASAQEATVYPIDLTAMITPPYTTCLEDMSRTGRFNINVLLRDFTKGNTDFVIEMKVSTTAGKVVFRSFIDELPGLSAGRPSLFVGSESLIGQLFSESHIMEGVQFITPDPANASQSLGCLKEGAYQFSFQAFAKPYVGEVNPIALSRPRTFMAFLQSTTIEPRLIYPYDDETFCNTSVPYQWEASNATGTPVSYHLEVAKVDELHGPSEVFDASCEKIVDEPELYTSSFVHNPTASNSYEPGATYAWRVTATANHQPRTSSVRTFIYCGTKKVKPAEPNLLFEKDELKTGSTEEESPKPFALFRWKEKTGEDKELLDKFYCGILIEVRKMGQNNWVSYEIDKNLTEFEIPNISYDETYEVRGSYLKCAEYTADGEIVLSDEMSKGEPCLSQRFKLPSPIKDEGCENDIPALSPCDEGEQYIQIKAGESFVANGTEVVVDKITTCDKNPNCVSGEGHVKFPIVKGIYLKMKFNCIKVNCARELAEGTVESVYNLNTCAMVNLEEFTGQGYTGGGNNPETDAEVNLVDNYDKNTSQDGDYFFDGDKVLMVNEKGNLQEIGKLITLDNQKYNSYDQLGDDSHFIQFSKIKKTGEKSSDVQNSDENSDDVKPDPIYVAFDDDREGYYRRISTTDKEYYYFDQNNKKCIIPWMANNPGKIKQLVAREVFVKNGENPRFDSLKFIIRCEQGYIELNSQKVGDDYIVDIPGSSQTSTITNVYAIGTLDGGKTYIDAGKLHVENYKEAKQEKDFIRLNIVVLYGGDLSDEYKKAAEEELKYVYGSLGQKFVVNWSVYNDNPDITKILENGLTVEKENVWRVESDEMRSIKQLYADNKGVEENTAYLFVVNYAQDFSGTAGDMPRSQSVGYLFRDVFENQDPEEFGRLVAHEAGHGVYGFQHIFDYPGVDQGVTHNLMDYTSDDHLAHFQWKIVQNPPLIVWSVLQDEEDGMEMKFKTGNPMVDVGLGTATDLAFQIGAEVAVQGAKSMLKGEEFDLGENMKSAMGEVLTADNIINTAIDNLNIADDIKNTAKQIVTMCSVIKKCNEEEETAKCLCEKMTGELIKSLLVDKIKDFIKGSKSKDPQETKDAIVCMFSVFGKEIQTNVTEVLKSMEGALDDKIAEKIVEKIAKFLCKVASDFINDIFSDNPEEVPPTDDEGFVHKLDYKVYSSDEEYDYIEFTITQASLKVDDDEVDDDEVDDNREDKLNYANLISISIPEGMKSLSIDDKEIDISDAEMEENHVYFVFHQQQSSNKENEIQPEGRDNTRVVVPYIVEKPKDKWECVNKYRVKVKRVFENKCCDYLLRVKTNQNLSASVPHHCEDEGQTKRNVSDECTEAGYDNNYKKNPFGVGETQEEATKKRQVGETNAGVPKCSGWSDGENDMEIITPFACGDPNNRIKGLFTRKKGETKATLDQDVAKKNLYKTFDYWDGKQYILLADEDGVVSMVDLDDFLNTIQDVGHFLLDIYTRMNIHLFSEIKGEVLTQERINLVMNRILSVKPGVEDNLWAMINRQINQLKEGKALFEKCGDNTFYLDNSSLQNKGLYDRTFNSFPFKTEISNLLKSYSCNKEKLRELLTTQCDGFISLLPDFMSYLCGVEYKLSIPKAFYEKANSYSLSNGQTNLVPESSCVDSISKYMYGTPDVNPEYYCYYSADDEAREMYNCVMDWNNLNNLNSVLLNRIQLYVLTTVYGEQYMNYRASGRLFRCDNGYPNYWQSAIMGVPANNGDSQSNNEYPKSVNDECFDSKDETYIQNPFGSRIQISATEYQNTRQENEIRLNLPRCSKWTRTDNGYFVSCVDIKGNLVNNLFYVDQDRSISILQSDAANKNQYHVFQGWNNTYYILADNTSELGDFHWIDLDGFIDSYQNVRLEAFTAWFADFILMCANTTQRDYANQIKIILDESSSAFEYIRRTAFLPNTNLLISSNKKISSVVNEGGLKMAGLRSLVDRLPATLVREIMQKESGLRDQILNQADFSNVRSLLTQSFINITNDLLNANISQYSSEISVNDSTLRNILSLNNMLSVYGWIIFNADDGKLCDLLSDPSGTIGSNYVDPSNGSGRYNMMRYTPNNNNSNRNINTGTTIVNQFVQMYNSLLSQTE